MNVSVQETVDVNESYDVTVWNAYTDPSTGAVLNVSSIETRYRMVEEVVTVLSAANKGFKILKFNFKFPRARSFELFRARSRLYRSQILQVNTRWN